MGTNPSIPNAGRASPNTRNQLSPLSPKRNIPLLLLPLPQLLTARTKQKVRNQQRHQSQKPLLAVNRPLLLLLLLLRQRVSKVSLNGLVPSCPRSWFLQLSSRLL